MGFVLKLDDLQTHPMPSWFEDAKFGIYAHWGPYSVPSFGSEWISRNMYLLHCNAPGNNTSQSPSGDLLIGVHSAGSFFGRFFVKSRFCLWVCFVT